MAVEELDARQATSFLHGHAAARRSSAWRSSGSWEPWRNPGVPSSPPWVCPRLTVPEWQAAVVVAKGLFSFISQAWRSSSRARGSAASSRRVSTISNAFHIISYHFIASH